MPVEGTSLKQ